NRALTRFSPADGRLASIAASSCTKTEGRFFAVDRSRDVPLQPGDLQGALSLRPRREAFLPAGNEPRAGPSRLRAGNGDTADRPPPLCQARSLLVQRGSRLF